ncbi:MAG TPA: ATP-dependent Clp protease adaptor ClpS [Ignavibacteria bacterium]|nr:ATP-dependent Clp protease adaptor ClpS [Ignavibacteria bacterium]
MSIRTKEKEYTDLIVTELRKLILYNSGHTWDEVIIQLEKATGYDMVHCEQIAMIAHTKGKAVVKSGELDELSKINQILKQINLITDIE